MRCSTKRNVILVTGQKIYIHLLRRLNVKLLQCSTVDISFKDYFVEMQSTRHQFTIPHAKLVEYGVVTSDRSSVIHEKLSSLNLVKGVDFELQDILQLRKQGGTSISKLYMLNLRSFKRCLMRARRYANQPVDPVKYCDYFALLEEMFLLFNLYENAKKSAKLSSLDSLVAELRQDREMMKREREEMKNMAREAHYDRIEVKEKLDVVVEKLEDTNTKLDDANEKLEDANEKLEDANTKLDDAVHERDDIKEELIETKEELIETKERVMLISEELGIEQTLRQNAVLATEVVQAALVNQMTKSGAIESDPAHHHVGCIMGRVMDGELELYFIARKISSAITRIRAMERDGYSQVVPMFFAVDPVALRCKNAEKIKETVFGRLTDRIRKAFGKALRAFGITSQEIVPTICRQKTYIPEGCSFTQDAFISNLERVILEITGMRLSEAINLAKLDLDAMKKPTRGRQSAQRTYDADSDAVNA